MAGRCVSPMPPMGPNEVVKRVPVHFNHLIICCGVAVLWTEKGNFTDFRFGRNQNWRGLPSLTYTH